MDDDDSIRKAVALALTRSGFQVVVAENGSDAVNKADSNIDLLLSDLLMPEMDGVQLGTLLQERQPQIQVLLMSAFAADAVALQDGWQFIRKPFRLPMLVDRLDSMLGISTSRALLAGERKRLIP